MPLLLIAMCSCGPKEGHVVSREFIPEHEVSYVVCTSDGDGGVDCDTETMTIPDAWQITVTLDGTNCGTWSCSQQDYDNATNGAWFRKGYGITAEPQFQERVSK